MSIDKTAMQELKEYCEQQAGIIQSEDYRLALEDVASWCERYYLPKEKEQIIKANNDGWEDGRREKFDAEKFFIDATDYYNKIYKK